MLWARWCWAPATTMDPLCPLLSPSFLLHHSSPPVHQPLPLGRQQWTPATLPWRTLSTTAAWRTPWLTEYCPPSSRPLVAWRTRMASLTCCWRRQQQLPPSRACRQPHRNRWPMLSTCPGLRHSLPNATHPVQDQRYPVYLLWAPPAVFCSLDKEPHASTSQRAKPFTFTNWQTETML